MSVIHVKRLQMAFDFSLAPLPPLEIPTGFRFVPWHPDLLKTHADVKYRSFRDDLDGKLFPTFRNYDRCVRLMDAIAWSSSFLPAATLLIATKPTQPNSCGPIEYVANIQGMKHSDDVGAIQNVAVLPEFRSRKLGRAVLLGSLYGFRKSGMKTVTLEVTGDNFHAVNLYENIGFKTYRTYFREIYQN